MTDRRRGFEVELFEIESPSTEVSSSTVARRTRRWPLVVLGVVAVVGLVALARTGDDVPVTAESTSTTEPIAATTTSTTAAESDSTRRPVTTTGRRPFGGPTFEYDTGYSLLIGGTGSSFAVNLDTGEERLTPGGFDIGLVVGDYVVGFDAGFNVGDSSVSAWRWAEDAAEPTSFRVGSRCCVLVPDVANESVWLPGETATTFERWSLPAGEIVETISLDWEPSGFLFASTDAGFEWLTGPTGGIHRRIEGSSYEKVADGAVLAISEGRILAQQCDEQLVCVFGWLDEATGELEVLNVAADAVAGGPFAFRQMVAGRFLLTFANGAPVETVALVDLDAERPTPVPLETPSSSFGNVPAMSPDGRFLAFSTNRGIVVRDLETDSEVLATPRSGFNIAFVPNS